jgi:hypothetical protein
VHNEELHNLYYSPYIIRMIKSRRMRWVGHVVHMGEMRNAYKILVGKPDGRDHSEDLGIGGRIIIKWILEKSGLGVWIGSIWLRIGTSGEFL